ncbi:MAG: carboxylating nicotinate-nucleotide diphosphorylase [Ignavibacterium sp.]
MNTQNKIEQIIKLALEEDIQNGDITTSSIISENVSGKGNFLCKEEGIIAGLSIVEKVFNFFDSSLKFKKYFDDGSKINFGDIIAKVEGKVSSILTTERTALNFLQRMSGIATSANKYSEKIKHTKAKIIDTRKTVPGLRLLDKMAVKFGGCENHRFGLYDMFLIKDNHIEIAGSISKAIQLCEEFKKKNYLNFKIEVETKNLDEVKEALTTNVDIIMLDNFSIEETKKAVLLINDQKLIEASGGITFENVDKIAETGVDYISVGALTHSVKALDISLEVVRS